MVREAVREECSKKNGTRNSCDKGRTTSLGHQRYPYFECLLVVNTKVGRSLLVSMLLYLWGTPAHKDTEVYLSAKIPYIEGSRHLQTPYGLALSSGYDSGVIMDRFHTATRWFTCPIEGHSSCHLLSLGSQRTRLEVEFNLHTKSAVRHFFVAFMLRRFRGRGTRIALKNDTCGGDLAQNNERRRQRRRAGFKLK
ncbi:hypothetical protein AUEXF2481DRAFT_608034 [Aureobasidium subglaciale EXF-2481]|uniref:Uncharacterized protein n=1 Tax=Aureobasidium subglaciale (strain EXF-2481) TaxID=1043005 RepID=A0A074XXH1_AURSE|nr:uncharacterized protein AUEXF2481DRAFT_608034 [Aureobasidium subglaciale EXF-2481]KEQ90160.1 hypothetical protein AUEXF2481DRAFT_608034 [Aureobasidium subglaciale EXF-2481]